MEDIVKRLSSLEKTISFMESCTGGYLTSSLTNIKDASKVLKFSAVTYSSEYKIKMGVSKEILDTYGVYSIETANEMSRAISDETNSDYGVGVTGELEEELVVYISIYRKDNHTWDETILQLEPATRQKNKEIILEKVIERLNILIKPSYN